MAINKIDLVFSGSGVRFIAQLWAYQKIARILKIPKLYSIHAIVATSGGTIPAMWIALGRTPEVLWKIIKQKDFSALEKHFLLMLRLVLLFCPGIPLFALLLLPYFGTTILLRLIFVALVIIPPLLTVFWYRKRFGILDDRKLRSYLHDLFQGARFSDLVIPLHIIAWDLNKGKVMIFSSKTHPEMRLVDACRMSMAVPGIFPLITYSFQKEEYWVVDGGFGGHTYYIDFFKDPKIPLIGIKVKSPREGVPKLSIRTFLISLINSIQDTFEREHMEDADWAHTFEIITAIPFLDFDLTRKKKEQLRRDGLAAVDRKRLINICEACK